ncbi:MAG: T9SS type A sorting domain-containing protein [Bacteroidales bacterium]|nr:T9SS type A sorting domain-containing protein [Bacteroidales bacterium]
MKKLFFSLLVAVLLHVEATAQVSKQQATNFVLASVVHDQIDSVNVFVNQTLQSSAYFSISPYDSIAVPFNNYWLYFIDDMPQWGWEHDCRYVFVNQNNGLYNVVQSHRPPITLYQDFECVQRAYEPILPAPISQNSNCTPLPEFNVNEGKYAVLFCGGESDQSNPTAFWNALSHAYCTLIEHGYMKDNIYVLSCDGVTGGSIGSNPSLDLDNDGLSDIIQATCSVENLRAVFDELLNKIDKGDMLYIFPVCHGARLDDNGSCALQLWNQELLYDTVFADMLTDINCAQMIVNIWSCYSGGMADDIIAISNDTKKTVLTCTDALHVEWRKSHITGMFSMDPYNYLITSALRNWHPDFYSPEPWCRYSKLGELGEEDFHYLFSDKDHEIDFNEFANGGNSNSVYEIGEILNYAQEYDRFFFTELGVKHYECGFEEDLLCLHGITGHVCNSQTISDNYHIEDVLFVQANMLTLDEDASLYLFDADVVIENGGGVEMKDGASIIAKSGACKVVVNGTLTTSGNVTFEAMDGASLEIVFQGDNVSCNSINFVNCTLTLPAKNISFTNCSFEGTPVLIENNSTGRNTNVTAYIENCAFNPNGKSITNALHIKGYPYYKVKNCVIDGTDGGFVNGISIQNCGGLTGYKSVESNEIAYCSGTGLRMYASHGNITMNKVHDNGYGVKLLNNCNIGQFSGNCASVTYEGTQYIYNNQNNEVYMTGSSIPEMFRYNAIMDVDNIPFVYHDAYVLVGDANTNPVRGSIDVAYNNWGSSFNANTHLFTSMVNGYYSYQPMWQLGTCDEYYSEASRLVRQADSLVELSQYSNASEIYRQVVENYSNTASAETALKSMLKLEIISGNDYASLQAYYLTEDAILGNECLGHLAESLANKCDELMQNYDNAIKWYERVINDPSTCYNDSVFAVIDLGTLYIEMATMEGKETIDGVCEFKPKSKKEHVLLTERLLSNLPQKVKSKGKYDIDPIINLEAFENEANGVVLLWDVPENSTLNKHRQLTWNVSMDGLDGPAGWYGENVKRIGIRFDTLDLKDVYGWKIKQIMVVPYAPENQQSVAVWYRNEDRMELVYEQFLSECIYGEWNTVELDEEVFIADGVEVVIVQSSYGDAEEDFALEYHRPPRDKNMYTAGSNGSEWLFCNLNALGFYLAANIESPNGKTCMLGNREGQSLSGYNVYRDGEKIASIPYPIQTYFIDNSVSNMSECEYCVTAVYGEEESEMVCTSYTGVDETTSENNMAANPNPTTGMVKIDNEDIQEIQVYNALGQQMTLVNNANQVDLSAFDAGVYMLRIQMKDGTTSTVRVLRL